MYMCGCYVVRGSGFANYTRLFFYIIIYYFIYMKVAFKKVELKFKSLLECDIDL